MRYAIPADELLTEGEDERGYQVLPVFIPRQAVANHDPNTPIYSSPFSDAVGFGVAAPQFTPFYVTGPQLGSRLPVANALTGAAG